MARTDHVFGKPRRTVLVNPWQGLDLNPGRPLS